MMHLQTPHDVQPGQYSEAVLIARQTCARIFAQGGTPADALAAFGLGADLAGRDGDAAGTAGWPRTVDRIAAALCVTPQNRAA